MTFLFGKKPGNTCILFILPGKLYWMFKILHEIHMKNKDE